VRTPVRRLNNAGFTLLEVLITAGLVVAVAAGASHILAIAVRASHSARVRTMASMLAAEKIEQLRSLTWSHVTTSSPAISISSSDFTTDLSTDPATDSGPGLLPSPTGTLEANVVHYFDYLDGSGRWAGGIGPPPPSAVYIRRWAVRPLASDPENILVFQVVVSTRAPGGMISPDAAHLASIEARK
jgi:type II secretory pathway pseudopilin PulG